MEWQTRWPHQSAAELVEGLKFTWQVIYNALSSWTVANLSDIVHDTDDSGKVYDLTRQWVIRISSSTISIMAANSPLARHIRLTRHLPLTCSPGADQAIGLLFLLRLAFKFKVQLLRDTHMEFETLCQDLAHGAEMIKALVIGVTQAESQVNPTPESWSTP